MIVYLSIATYKGSVPLAIHYYGTLKAEDHEPIWLEKTLTAIEAAVLNRYESGYTWEEGCTTSRLKSEDEARKIGMSSWREFYPTGQVLMEGEPHWREPQFILTGLTPEQRIALNSIFMACEKLGWWDGGNVAEVSAKNKEWHGLLARYLEVT